MPHDDAKTEALAARPGDSVPTAPAPRGEETGSQIGPYRLMQQLGEGGFGSVFLAEQTEPVRRRVALKIIKLGMDTRQVIARFEQERQALAMMDHPNIARVLDAGATEAGRPYFVMELVKGEPITDYCDRRSLGLAERLGLFVQVCRAVQHAHTKGLIHRDLKPGNVLVSAEDRGADAGGSADGPAWAGAVAKVIDFGIAKATGGQLTDKTIFTEHRQLIGTLEYMSPEQAEGSLDIDTRTDVYSLGVLLYELLTGTTPFESERLRSAAYAEVQRIISEDEPPRPSTRLGALGAVPGGAPRGEPPASVADIAARRRTDPPGLTRALRGDLDWIVMKALEKDRARRYETANGLALDVLRHLSGDPVTAAPPSAAYRLKKFVRRNRAGVVAGAAVAAALVLGILGTSAGLIRALNERARANTYLASEAQQRLRAEGNEKTAREDAARAERERDDAEKARRRAELIAGFMSDTLLSAGPRLAPGRDTTLLREMMDAAAARIENGDLADAPEAELRLRGTLGNTYRELAAYDAAVRLLEPAVALASRLHPGDHPDVATALSNLAFVRQSLGRADEAERLFGEALETYQRLFPGDHPSVAQGLNNLAAVRGSLGRAAETVPLYTRALDMNRRLYPGDHPEVALSLNNLGLALQSLGRAAEAEPLCVEALDMGRRLFPDGHQDVAQSLNNLAGIRRALGQVAEAERLYQEALELRQRLFPGDHPDVAVSLNNLGLVRQSMGRGADAEGLLERALEMRRRLFPGDHPAVAGSLNNLAFVRDSLGRPAEAEQLYLQAAEMYRRLFRGDHPSIATSLNNLALVRRSLDRAAEAEPLAEEALAMRRRMFSGDHPDVARSLHSLALIRESLGRAAQAEQLFASALEMRERILPKGHADTQLTMVSLAEVRETLSMHAEAERAWRGLVEARRAVLPAGDWRVANAVSRLGGSVLNQGRCAEAEPLLIEGFEGLSAASDTPRTPNDRLREACERVVHLYEAWETAEPGKGYGVKGAEWKARLEALPPAAAASR